MLTALFWANTQRVLVISYGRFLVTRVSYLQGSRIQKKCFFHFLLVS